MNFQVTVLKILVSYPDGFALMEDLKRDMAILATSGRDWSERTKRLASRLPGLDIFSQGLVERQKGGWRITERGRSALELMEARPKDPDLSAKCLVRPPALAAPPLLPLEERAWRRRQRRHRRRVARERLQAKGT
ncbi:hypothetical protein [Bradyrhizobium sp. USDA 4449]